MKSNKVIHHPGRDASVFSTVEDQIETHSTDIDAVEADVDALEATVAALGDTFFTLVLKEANEPRNATTTLTNDAALTFPMAAATDYVFRMELWFDTVAAADFKFRHTGPASPGLVRITRHTITPGGTALGDIAVDVAYSSADVVVLTGGTTGGYVRMSGIINNGVNAGDFYFQWAQNTSDAGFTTVRAGSYLEYRVVP